MGFEVFQMGEIDRQIRFVNSTNSSSRIACVVKFMKDWEGLPPKTLTTKKPIAEFVINGLSA